MKMCWSDRQPADNQRQLCPIQTGTDASQAEQGHTRTRVLLGGRVGRESEGMERGGGGKMRKRDVKDGGGAVPRCRRQKKSKQKPQSSLMNFLHR